MSFHISKNTNSLAQILNLIILANRATNKIKEKFHGKLYKQDADETQRCVKVVTKLLSKSSLTPFIPNLKVYVVHVPTIGCFMSMDESLFISVKLLKLASNDDELALFISHEIWHYLLGHSAQRYLNIASADLFSKLINPSLTIKGNKDELEDHAYSWFNHRRIAFDKFYERRTDMMSHDICHKAGYDLFKGIEIYKKISEFVGPTPKFSFKATKANFAYNHYEMAKLLLKQANLQ